MQALALYDGVIIVGILAILAIVALTLEWIDRRRRNRRFENGGKGRERRPVMRTEPFVETLITIAFTAPLAVAVVMLLLS
jgi:hypothetical protein